MVQNSIEGQSNYRNIVKAYKDANIRSIGLEGGSRSGKTYDVCIFLLQYIYSRTGKTIVIGRDNKTTLNTTTYKTFKDVFSLFVPMKWPKYPDILKINNNLIYFIGTNDDQGKAQGMEGDIVWINEADLCDKDTVDQLEQRMKELLILDYNPRHYENWCYDREALPHHILHKTTVLDNKFAPPTAKHKIMSYEPTEKNIALGTADEYKWSVYGLGERSVGEQVIFTNWVNIEEWPEEYEDVYFGGDFGYVNDPCAIIEVRKNGRALFLREHLYEVGLTNFDLAERIKMLNLENETIIFDRAELKSINELITLGVDVQPGRKKKPGDIMYGVQKLLGYSLYVYDSPNLEFELKNYSYIKERNGNYRTNSLGQRIPTDKNNHLIDALRYAVTTYLY